MDRLYSVVETGEWSYPCHLTYGRKVMARFCDRMDAETICAMLNALYDNPYWKNCLAGSLLGHIINEMGMAHAEPQSGVSLWRWSE